MTDLPRRRFVAASGSALGGAWLWGLGPLLQAAGACASEAAVSGRPFETFTDREGADFDAFGALIVPTDDTPGAREAGVVYFADRALGSFFDYMLPIVRPGLADLAARAVTESAGVAGFADLTEERQAEVLRAVEEEEPTFFFFARTLVLLGLVSNPSYGGNRNEVGWRLLGFEPRFAHQPPFGFYDRDEHGEPGPEPVGAPGSPAGPDGGPGGGP